MWCRLITILIKKIIFFSKSEKLISHLWKFIFLQITRITIVHSIFCCCTDSIIFVEPKQDFSMKPYNGPTSFLKWLCYSKNWYVCTKYGLMKIFILLHYVYQYFKMEFFGCEFCSQPMNLNLQFRSPQWSPKRQQVEKYNCTLDQVGICEI